MQFLSITYGEGLLIRIFLESVEGAATGASREQIKTTVAFKWTESE